jgi:conjugative transposon TraK protein
MVIKNLENKIKLVSIVCCFFLVGCIVISLGSIWTARSMVVDAQQKIFVLDGNVPILVERTTMDETLDVEAKSHVERFHHLFFTLAPDDKYIKYTMEKAMYLVDETGLAQYNTLKERGFYNNIMGTSAVFSIFCDSIKFNQDKMEFTYYGRQRIERRTNILTRELVTAGKLKRVPRTENNPHGLLITGWRTLLNKDLEQKTKSNYKHVIDMGWKKMIMGEQMPDKNDPKYKERYEREVSAGRKFAKAAKFDSLRSRRTGFCQRTQEAVPCHRVRFGHPEFQFQSRADGENLQQTADREAAGNGHQAPRAPA